MTSVGFPIDWVKQQFPALKRKEVFSDNAAGTQLPLHALHAINEYFTEGYALGGSAYAASKRADIISDSLRQQFKGFLGAENKSEIQFGFNATNLLRLLSTALFDQFKSGEEIIVTALDHEANITPWLRLQQKGVKINYWKPRGPERILAEGDLRALLNQNTRFVMVTGASNVLGTATNLQEVCKLAHESDAGVIVDAVHMAPHRPIDVKQLGVDVLVGSGYKLFGPKLGFMYIKQSLLDSITSLNHYFLDGVKLEIGAPNYEAMAAFLGVFEYLTILAEKSGYGSSAREAMIASEEWEKQLTLKMLDGIQGNDDLILHGITDKNKIDLRLPTFALRHRRLLPAEMAEKLAENGIHCRYGHMYAPRLIESLKLRSTEGVCRISLAHYNTVEEVDRILEVLNNL
jgi:cysteine desulfurase family protein (TIGR01976 family)